MSVCLAMRFLGIAEVAELVDALGSGSSGRTAVGVRVPASALRKSRGYGQSVAPFLCSFAAWVTIWVTFSRMGNRSDSTALLG